MNSLFFCDCVSRRIDATPICSQTTVRVCLIHNNNNNEGRTMTKDELKAALQIIFPESAVSVGYIGSISVYYDDRSFRIWANDANGVRRHVSFWDQDEAKRNDLSFENVFHAISKMSQLTGVEMSASFANLRLLFS